MLIERIVKKDDNTVIVYLNNGEKLFLSYEVVIKNGLRKGLQLSEDRFEFLVIQNRMYHVKNKALSYLSKRTHSKRELENKLRQKNYDNNLISEVLDELLEKGIINDKLFAEQYTDEKINKKNWGILKVKSELYKKGISPDIINEILSSFSDSEFQLSNAINIAKKKIVLISRREPDTLKVKKKTISFLISRGFSYDIALESVNTLLNESDSYD